MTPTPPEALLPCPHCNGEGYVCTNDDPATQIPCSQCDDGTVPVTAQPLPVAADDEALNVHRFSFDGRAIEVDGEYEFVKASEVRRRIAELQYAVAVWRGKAEMRGREGAQARAALAEVRDKTIEECAAIATARRNQWSCAGGFGGHSAGARIIQDEILALNDKEPTNG